MSNSAAERDVVKMYNLHANCYITKPMQLAGYREIVQAIKEFWFGVVKLPPN